MAGFMDCIRRFSQVILIITNITVSVLGLLVMIIGIWANVNGKNYVVITDDGGQFTEVSVLIIVVGLFVMMVGAVGVGGAIFAHTMCGRITLALYGVVLTILVICEIAGGIAAAAKKGDLQNVFTESANSTFQLYYQEESKRDAWDSFQSSFKCCGVQGTRDYGTYLGNATVPSSCCRKTVGVDCESERTNPESEALYQQGCVGKIVDGFKHNLGAIAGGAIVLGLMQIFGIVMACFVALYNKKDSKYEVV